MAYQPTTLPKNLFISLLILSSIIYTKQQESCVLPDGKRQSTCIRFHYCDHFATLIRQYNGNPPQDIRQTIRSHYCPSAGFVCCPDNAVAITTTAAPPVMISPATITEIDQKVPKSLPNLNTLKSHPNFGLLNEKTCGLSTSKRIIGGVDADLLEFPWAALLGYELLDSLAWQCGGSLISKEFVLTAAHCLLRSLAKVRLGEYNTNTGTDCDDDGACADPVQDLDIVRKIKHPLYSSLLKRNDIAILKLSAPADTTKNNVRTICLPTSVENELDKVKMKNFVITGWGKLANGQASEILQKAYVPFVEHNSCVQRFAPHRDITIYHTLICAGGHNKTDTCKGDSGGGIGTHGAVNGKPRMILYGVVSGGVECLDPKLIYPGIYTDIRYYMDWILDNMS